MSLPHTNEWSRALPETLPAPTYWPAALALGSTLFAWGFLTSWIISAVGLALFAFSLSGWIRDLLREQTKEAE